MIGGPGLERIDVVTHCSGLRGFDAEYRATILIDVGHVRLRLLPIDRIITSKLAANRPKDRAVIEQLRAVLAVKRRG